MVRWHQREGKKIPTNWAYDRHGRETDEPTEALDGPLVPMGMFKGTRLSIFTDMLCGVLTGAAFSSALYADSANHDVGHMLIAIDIERFLPYDRYLERMRAFCDELKASELAPGFDEVLLPGELEQRRTQRCLVEGVDFDVQGMTTLLELAGIRDVPFLLDENWSGAPTS